MSLQITVYKIISKLVSFKIQAVLWSLLQSGINLRRLRVRYRRNIVDISSSALNQHDKPQRRQYVHLHAAEHSNVLAANIIRIYKIKLENKISKMQ